jgi:hypothetical protein
VGTVVAIYLLSDVTEGKVFHAFHAFNKLLFFGTHCAMQLQCRKIQLQEKVLGISDQLVWWGGSLQKGK